MLKLGFYLFLLFLSSSLYSQRATGHIISDKMTDIEGKQYDVIKIGEISWVQRNLDVARFRNGDLIKNAASKKDWIEAGKNEQPAWCYYENDPSQGKIYGKLYNWYAVNDSRGLCAKGWHVPSFLEWKNLTSILGDKNVSGGKLKSKGTTYWWNPNSGATNEFGFSVLEQIKQHFYLGILKIQIEFVPIFNSNFIFGNLFKNISQSTSISANIF